MLIKSKSVTRTARYLTLTWENNTLITDYHDSFLVPVVLKESQKVNIAASKSKGNNTKKMKFH